VDVDVRLGWSGGLNCVRCGAVRLIITEFLRSSIEDVES
jgi:hypothetical protein